jgi:AcrR family transcriptional regulator
VSVNAIGKELAVSGPALYSYFASRDDLLTELAIDAYDDLPAERPAAPRPTALRPTPARLRRARSAPDRGLQGGMDLLLEVLPRSGEGTRPSKALASQASEWATGRGLQTDAATAVRALLTWSRSHGFARVEIDGNYASMDIEPDALAEIEPAGTGALA